jgi:PAS domain S-box-containing protein
MAAAFEHYTQLRQTVAARQEEAERLHLLLKVTHILPWEADFPSSKFTYVGEEAADLLGYPAEDWYQSDFWSAHLHPDDRGRAMAKCLALSNGRDNYELECRMIAKDGRVVWLQNLLTVIRENGSPKTILGFSIDITKSKQNENALRDLTGRLINAQEEERRRVARELHDDLNQRMALLSIELEQLAQVEKPSDLGRRLKSVQNHAREISVDIHRLSYKLHPSKLDHLGLAAAVKSLCHEFCAMGNLVVEFQQSEFPETLPNDVTLCVFRIAQEALRNCAKHSGARSARVRLETTSEGIRLSVSDDGCGFNMDSEAKKKGLGFTSMRERVRIVGGQMEVHSKPMHGTIIEVSVPLVLDLETANI